MGAWLDICRISRNVCYFLNLWLIFKVHFRILGNLIIKIFVESESGVRQNSISLKGYVCKEFCFTYKKIK